MENSNFNTVVVRDSRIQDISTKLDYKVYKGAAQSTHQSATAQNVSTSSINVNVQVPSENIVMDRELTLTASPTFRADIPVGVAVGDLCFSYGYSEALNQFPLNSLFINATATINTASVSVNTQDIMHCLLRATDEESLSKYNAPHMPDKKFKKYSDMVLSESNPLGAFKDAKGGLIPRGSHPISFTARRYVNGVLAETVTQASTAGDIITALTSTSATTNTWQIDITFESTEPLLFMSPFVFGEHVNNSAGLYGVNTMNFVFNLDTSCKRLLSSASPHAINLSLTAMNGVKMNLNYLTCQPSDLLATKNVVPYVEYARYPTVKSGTVNVGGDTTINSQTLSLNQIPNRIFIVCRKPMNNQTIKDSNSFWAIEDMNITFNNMSGILSGAGAHELYKISKANGSKQDWYEFAGKASNVNGVQASTIGSIVILNPARDMNLPDYLSNGSTGQFSFQCNVKVRNTDAVNMEPELLIIVENCGVFITQAGQSTFQSSLLTKDLVMNSTMNQFGESDNYIKSFNNDNSANSGASGLKNVPLLNKKKVSGAGSKSGGATSGGGW